MIGKAQHRALAAIAFGVALAWTLEAAAQGQTARPKTGKAPAAEAAPARTGTKSPPAAQRSPAQPAPPAQQQKQPQRPPAAGAAKPRPDRNVVPAGAVEPVAGDAPPAQPFTLTPAQQANVDRLLGDWEQRNLNVKTVTCKFERWEFDRVTNTRKYATGELNYNTPDNAEYKVYDSDGNVSEHWLCTGKSIFEFKHSEKTLVQRDLPPELQGKAIEDGPLPFVFNSNAAKLKQRYWMRLTAPPEGVTDQVWIEAFPKRREDKANFDRAELILNANEMLPMAVQLHMPGGQTRTVHKFKDTKVNGFWAGLKGFKPKVSRDWKVYVEPAGGMAEAPPAQADPAQPRSGGAAPVAGRPSRPAAQ